MADKKYIDAEKLISGFEKARENAKHLMEVVFFDGVLAIIDGAPSADVAEVVRCKDCKRYAMCFRNIRTGGNLPDDFCSCGERRSEDA